MRGYAPIACYESYSTYPMLGVWENRTKVCQVAEKSATLDVFQASLGCKPDSNSP